MRINGNHIERLVFCIAPLAFIVTLVLYLANVDGGKMTLIAMAITSIAYWTMDTIFLRVKKPKSLKIEGGSLKIGNKHISILDILEIIPVTDRRLKWSLELIKIRVVSNEEFLIIDKPRPFWYIGKESRSIELLISEFPILSSKVQARASN